MMSRNSNNSTHPTTTVGPIQSDEQNSNNKSAALHLLPASAGSVSHLPPLAIPTMTTTSLFAASRSYSTEPVMEVGVGQLSSPPSSLPEQNKYQHNADDDDDDVDGGSGTKWQQQPGSLSDDIGHGSSVVPFLGGGNRDQKQSPIATLDNDGSWSANIYENVVNGSLKQQLSFGGYGKLRKCEENIYENICEDCGRLYSAEKCSFCAVEDEEDVERTKKVNKYSAKFQEFLGNFRIRPVRFGGSAGVGSTFQSKRKLCKSDIVHNVDGFEHVFRTNKSFDLGAICRMRDDVRSQRSVDRVLHKSDDQLTLAGVVKHITQSSASTLAVATAAATATEIPPATEEKATPSLKVRRSVSENLIDFSESRKSETIYENLSPSSAASAVVDRKRLVRGLVGGGASGDVIPVKEWMMSLLVQTEDYDAGEVTYHVKSIPSVTFNDISADCGNGWKFRGKSYCASDLSYKVEEIRQNVINNQKREKVEEDQTETLDPVVISFCNSEFENSKEDERSDGTLTPGSAGEGDKSEFVSGLLNIFEAVLNREKEGPRQNSVAATNGHANDVIRPYRAQVNELDSDSNTRLSHNKQHRSSKLSRKHILMQKYLLDVSLCRVVITYERRLKAFLLVATVGEVVRKQKLLLNKRKTYLNIMTNEFHNSASALQESVEIDSYFQFLENNKAMINLVALKRRRRRRGEFISPELQSNSSNEISCSSSTSGVHSDCGTSLDENIYQQIWTCKTEGTEPVYESPQENIYESIRLEPARDENEWEVVDDFAFSKSNRRTLGQKPPPVPNRNIRHPLDRYKNVCIMYSPAEPKINRIVYNYRRDYIFDYRKCDESVDSSVSSFVDDDEELEFCESCAESEDYEEDGSSINSTSRGNPRKNSCYSIPDCVQYWKFMLLNVNYNDDEEDVIMTEKTLTVIAENIEKVAPSTEHQQSSPKIIHHPPSSPGTGLLPHSPTFSGPTAKNRPQLPVTDSCVGTYTSKSAENLPDVVVHQEKEKSPNPKRERLRDKMKAVLNPSRNSDDGLVFGVELDQVERDDKLQVPRFVVECVEILKQQEYMETSGLYRASGNKNSIENIKKKLNERRSPKKYDFLKKQDVHSLTGSLKLFFRELKFPLIPKDVYESCVQKTKDQSETIEQIKLSIEKMELINRNTLRYLIRHLKCVHQHSDVNMMNSSNLAIVWGACLFASTLGLMESYENNDLGKINTLVKQLIDHYDKIFYGDKTD
ncbi:uncharacterized protein LOC135708835 isoform X2 [Ochlerotatus camptorhynchus]|uniref:uncharacterized protein LOC135708835 isoform X2 n=1 Tax=Ochlerotatus camptorhynchus TaxID=644619 RepID=UPI0031CE4998